jgi:hypothetical protein
MSLQALSESAGWRAADKHEPDHKPQFHRGLVLKHNVNQRYATNAISATLFRRVCSPAPHDCAILQPACYASLLLVACRHEDAVCLYACMPVHAWQGKEGGFTACWPSMLPGKAGLCWLTARESLMPVLAQGGGAAARHPDAGVLRAQRHGMWVHHRAYSGFRAGLPHCGRGRAAGEEGLSASVHGFLTPGGACLPVSCACTLGSRLA